MVVKFNRGSGRHPSNSRIARDPRGRRSRGCDRLLRGHSRRPRSVALSACTPFRPCRLDGRGGVFCTCTSISGPIILAPHGGPLISTIMQRSPTTTPGRDRGPRSTALQPIMRPLATRRASRGCAKLPPMPFDIADCRPGRPRATALSNPWHLSRMCVFTVRPSIHESLHAPRP